MNRELEILEEHRAFGGKVGTYSHTSKSCNCKMKFAVFVPPQAVDGPVPALTYLAGLTCTHETFMTKAGALARAAELGLMLIAPDTSPRGKGVPDDPDGAWDFGLGAGFYLDATAKKWSRHYNMHSYVTRDLQEAVFANFPGDPRHQGVFGHSMGGHGALVLGMRHPELYKSISAFAPVVSPIDCPWGKKAFKNYLGRKSKKWDAYDASRVILGVKGAAVRNRILIDQGLDDEFLSEQLMPGNLQAAADKVAYNLEVRRHEGYDHGYYFISTFIDDHLDHHAGILQGGQGLIGAGTLSR